MSTLFQCIRVYAYLVYIVLLQFGPSKRLVALDFYISAHPEWRRVIYLLNACRSETSASKCFEKFITSPGFQGEFHDLDTFVQRPTDGSNKITVVQTPTDGSNKTMVVQTPMDGFNKTNGIKTILLTTHLLPRLRFGLQLGRSLFHTCNCSEWRCELTNERTKFEMANAVIFETCGKPFHKLWELRDWMNQRARPHQIYVFHDMEAPVRNPRKLSKYPPDVFNLTMTYRRDSDVRVPYWRLVKRTRPKLTGGMDLQKVRNKSRTAVWFISHCERRGSKRWKYVNELRKHVDVDVYGDCGNLSCPRNLSDLTAEEKCFRMVSQTYYFYLAFENAFCKDYHTEKILNAWSNEMVPVVHGSFDDVLPPYSALDVREFANPEALAQKMSSLRDNSTEYMKYFDFKKFYDIKSHDCDRGFCRLCEILHDPGYKYKSRFDLYQWWVGQGECWSERQSGRFLGLA